MNRKPAGSEQETPAGIDRVLQASDGLFELYAMTPEQMATVFAEARAGDPLCYELGFILGPLLDRAHCCAICDRRLARGKPFSAVIARAQNRAAAQAMGFAICLRCAGNGSVLMARAHEAFKRLVPDAQPVEGTFHAEDGHA
jgi:hypothetical protein